MNKKVSVVGSINMDLVVKLDEIPKIGETLMGKSLSQIPGGKGSNQAIAISKLGKRVSFLGKVGNDPFGEKCLEAMEMAEIDVDNVEKTEGESGIALINVDKFGRNNIVVIAGANDKVDKEYLDRNIETFKGADIVLFQHEIPMESVKHGLKLAKDLKKTTILNPAPAKDLDRETIGNIDIIIPNEYELERISKIEIKNDDDLIRASKRLLEKGIKIVVTTLGDKGVLHVEKDICKFFKPYKVDVVDTTAAGDSFIGGFVSSYISDQDIEKAIDYGQRTASLAIQRFGAASSIPTKKEVEESFKN